MSADRDVCPQPFAHLFLNPDGRVTPCCYLAQGEPFIQRDFYRLIDEVSGVNSTCRWVITTNGHYRLTNPEELSVLGMRAAMRRYRDPIFARVIRPILETLPELGNGVLAEASQFTESIVEACK